MEKVCTICKVGQPVENYHRQPLGKDGLKPLCKECNKKRVQEWKKTKKGVISTIFYNQKRVSKRRGHGILGYTRDEFKVWLLNNVTFNKLFEKWKVTGDKSDKPSIDRLDDYKGYTFDNIRVVTWGVNQDKYYNDVKEGRNNKRSKAIIQYDMEGNFLNEYHSIAEASRSLDLSHGCISRCCNGYREYTSGFKFSFKNK